MRPCDMARECGHDMNQLYVGASFVWEQDVGGSKTLWVDVGGSKMWVGARCYGLEQDIGGSKMWVGVRCYK